MSLNFKKLTNPPQLKKHRFFKLRRKVEQKLTTMKTSVEVRREPKRKRMVKRKEIKLKEKKLKEIITTLQNANSSFR